MKTKRILSALMSAVMVFIMFSVLTVLTVTEAPLTAKAATATKKAFYIGPSTLYDQVPSAIFFPLENQSKYGDNTIVQLTAKVKMLNSTVANAKPYVQLYRAITSTTQSTTLYTADDISATGNNRVDNANSTLDANGNFTCNIRFGNIPGDTNCYKYSQRNGRSLTRVSITGHSTPKWGAISIGNCIYNDNATTPSNRRDFGAEFIITDISVKITTLSGGSGGYVGMELAPSVANFASGQVYSNIGDVSGSADSAYNTTAHNFVLEADVGKWSALTQDQDTVRQVTVADDFMTASHTYTKHSETDYAYEYYTCSDFGSTKFEKIGNCYSVITDDDIIKKAIVIKSHGDSGSYANIFLPMNNHKYWSAYDSPYLKSGFALQESGANVRIRVQMTAKRISGTGEPILGRMYAYGTNQITSGGTTYTEYDRLGAPAATNPKRAWNNNVGKSETNPDSGFSWVKSTRSYDPTTGAFDASIAMESGYYNQMSRQGINDYLTIGTLEHDGGGKDAYTENSTFVISDIKITVYAPGSAGNVIISSDAAPKMTANNIDTTTTYGYCPYWQISSSNNEWKQFRTDYFRGIVRSGMRTAPLGKYACEGSVQNITTVDKNVCIHNHCTLTPVHDSATGLDYYSCSTHGKYYSDACYTKEYSNNTITKKMVVVRSSGSRKMGVFIPLDNDGWSGDGADKTFIFKCKMKIFGDEIPVIQQYAASWWGGIGTISKREMTSSAVKNGSNTLWTDYDASTCTYTACFKIRRYDPSGTEEFFRGYNSATGAHTVLMLGNYKQNGSGGDEPRPSTGFAFTDPELYEATNAATGAYTGSNICTPITDKTVDLGTNYSFANLNNVLEGTSVSETADRGLGSISNAPLRTWSRSYYSGTADFMSVNDVPSDFFTNSSSSRMFKMAGVNTNSSYAKVTSAISQEVFLDQNTEYIFDLDYRSFGGVDPSIRISLNAGSYSLVTEPTEVIDQLGHKRVRFTTPASSMVYDAASNGGNFMFQIGLDSDASLASSLYVANIQLRKYNSGSPGKNHLLNGDFAFGSLGTVDYSNGSSQLPFWNTSAGAVTGSANYKYSHCAIMTAPANFFANTASPTINASNLAIKVTGGTDNNSFQFEPTLEANQYYKLTFYYNFSDTGTTTNACTLPTLQQYSHLTTGSKSTTNIPVSSKASGGYYQITCQFQAPSNLATSISGNYYHANTRLRFNFGSNASSKTFYIYNVSLRKLSGAGGSEQGVNILANVNPIFNSSTYSSLTSVGATSEVNLGANDITAMTRELGNGWFRDGGGVTASLVKVPSNFFNAPTAANRIANIRHIILADGEATSDGVNPIYNPNGDATWGDVKDLVHTKRFLAANGF